MLIEVQPTPDELAELYRFYNARHWQLRYRWPLAIAVGAGLVAFGIYMYERRAAPAMLGLYIVFGLLLMGISIAEYWTERHPKPTGNPIFLDIGEAGITASGAGIAQLTVSWKAWRAFAETEHLFLLLRARRRPMLIPKRALDGAAQGELLHLLRKNLPAAN